MAGVAAGVLAVADTADTAGSASPVSATPSKAAEAVVDIAENLIGNLSDGRGEAPMNSR